MAGPGYSGYFLKGLAGGLQSGINIGLQITELKWKKDQKKKLEEKEKKIEESMTAFGSLIKQYGADNIYSDDEVMQLNTALMSSIPEVQAIYANAVNNIQAMNKRKLDEDYRLLDLVVSSIDGLDPSNTQGIFDTARGFAQTEKGKNYFTAYKNIYKKQYEAQQLIEPEIKEPKITDYGIGLTYLKNIINVSPENWETAKKGLESKFGVDYSGITQEALKEAATEDKKYYSSAEEAMTTSPDIKGLSKQPVQISLDQWKIDYTKETVPKPTPEGEITAGEKRTYDMASSIMFGSSDWVTGISKPGIISTMISNKLNMGQPLTDEEKAEVRNNWNFIKGELPEATINIVESQLRRYGIPLEEPTPTVTPEVTPTVTPEPKPGLIDKAKSWLGIEGAPPKMKPVWGLEEKAEEIPTPKVPTESKEAMIPLMSKKELEEAIKGLDPSDPIYKLIYDEAVKRGYIKK